MMEQSKDGPLTVIAGLPMYNEEETIGTILMRTQDYVSKVICVDDGSSDSCASIASKMGADVIRHRFNRGYGGALKSIFHRAIEEDVDILVVLDADGQHDPEDIPRIIQPIKDGKADIVIGSRFVEGGDGKAMPAYRRMGIKVITAASNLSSDLGISDTQSGFRAFSRLALERLRFDSEGMELSLELLEDAHEKELVVTEIPTVIRYDVPKGSSFTPLSHGFVVLAYALVTLSQKKPLLVLGLPGITLLLAGAAMGMRAVNQVSEYTQFSVGPGLSAVWVGVLGLALLATGVVLQSARSFMRLLIVREFGMD
jgi:glycosyltransferase involved in cell wall biosynthesis